jgi:hypothetical protein
MAKKLIEPDWVCFDCAKQRGARVPEHHLCTVHIDICGICKMEVEVTEPRDFGRTRNLLLIEIDTKNKKVEERE